MIELTALINAAETYKATLSGEGAVTTRRAHKGSTRAEWLDTFLELLDSWKWEDEQIAKSKQITVHSSAFAKQSRFEPEGSIDRPTDREK